MQIDDTLLQDQSEEVIAILLQVAGEYTLSLKKLFFTEPTYVNSLSPEQVQELIDIQLGYADLFEKYGFDDLVFESGLLLESLLENKV